MDFMMIFFVSLIFVSQPISPVWCQEAGAPDLLEGDTSQAQEAQPSTMDSLEGEGSTQVTAPHTIQKDDSMVCDGQKVCFEKDTKQPLRVLPRPLSNIYKEPSAVKDQIARANIPAFKPLFVFERKEVDFSNPADPSGWYKVGYSDKKPDGWMRAKDVFEWRQALLVSYTHPGEPGEGRYPVLMFRDLSQLKEIVESGQLEERAKAIYKEIEQKKVPPGVVSMEPKRFVDIMESFYLLPILNYEMVEIDGDEARYLQIAAAVPGKRGADTLNNPDYLEQASADSTTATKNQAQNLKVDLVFVIDTTRSMQPYIDMTREAVIKITRKLGGDLKSRIKFGLVGYRDSVQLIPQLEYTSKNFTPQLVDGDTLVKLLEEKAKATSVGSHDYQEEVFAGIDTALNSAWRDNALHFIVLIGDASSHPLGHPQNTTGFGAEDLLRMAEDQKVHIIALHLKDKRAAKDHELADEQFGTLSRIRGAENESALIDIDAFKKEDFQKAVDTIVSKVGDRTKMVIAAASSDKPVSVFPPPPPMPDEVDEQDTQDVAETAKRAFDKAWNSALVEYLGQEANPPKDIVAWTIDRDLVDPTQKSLDVRVLVTRNQLSTLAQTLDSVIKALNKAQLSQIQFFDALQAVASQTMKRPEDIAKAQTLVDTGLLPSFIKSLPYKSDIMALSNEMFASMTADERAELLWSLKAKLKQYRQITERVDAWHKLNDSDSDSEMVYPLNLDYLP